jgi:hypothetical protein
MKNIIIAASLIAALAANAEADVPGKVTFTARLVNNGTPHEGAANVRLQLFDSTSSTTPLWTENHSVNADKGLVSVTLGAQDMLDESIIDGGDLFLELTVDNQVLSPRLAIGSVPYALMAGRASKLGMLAETDVQRRVVGVCAPGTAARMIDAAGAMTCEPTTYTFGSGLTETSRNVTIDTNVVQARVAGSCATGSSVRAIASNGSVTCQPDSTGLATASTSGGITSSVSGSTLFLGTDSTVQKRNASINNMTCPTGQYMRTIASTGQVTCVPALTCSLVTGTSTAGTATVSCPAGNIVMGGGCASTSNTQILDSYPSSTLAWFCRTTSTSTIQARAVCCDVSF